MRRNVQGLLFQSFAVGGFLDCNIPNYPGLGATWLALLLCTEKQMEPEVMQGKSLSCSELEFLIYKTSMIRIPALFNNAHPGVEAKK